MGVFGVLSGYDTIHDELPDVGTVDVDHSALAGLIELPQTNLAGIFNFLDIFKSKAPSATSPAPVPAAPSHVKDVFKTTQAASNFTFNTHPAVVMAIAYMKKSIDHYWPGHPGPVRDLIFPDMSTDVVPAKLSVAGLEDDKFKEGAVGLLVKAFYNACPDQQSNIEIDRANRAVQSINEHINSKSTELVIQFYRSLFSLTASDNMVSKYRILLQSTAYKTMKQHQASQGAWSDANLEMFCHFAKLAACGASDDQIKDTYQELTTKEPKLDGSSYGSITPSTWKSYRGWFSSVYIDYGDLGAKKLNERFIRTVPSFHMFPDFYYPLVEDFIIEKGYKKPLSSSCFSSDTRVIVDSSGKTRLICELRSGDSILSPETSSMESFTARRIAFIDTPHRHRRKLYSLRSHPGINFTSTHPIVLPRPSDEDSILSSTNLWFVDKDGASSLNPAWQSLATENLDPSLLETHEAIGVEDELLYDLVFEPQHKQNDVNCRPVLYIVESNNKQRLTVASEAPPLAWYPFELAFMGQFISQFSSQASDLGKVIDLICATNFDTLTSLRETASKMSADNAKNDNATIQKISQMLLQTCAGSQETASLIEKLIVFLGRSLSHEIRAGWARLGSVGKQSILCNVLFLHVVRQLDGTHGNHAAQIGSTQRVKVWCEATLVFDEQIDGNVQGHSTVELYQPIVLADECMEEGNTMCRRLTFEIVDVNSKAVWSGAGPLRTGLDSMIGLGSWSDLSLLHHAVAEVELRRVPKEAFAGREGWDSARMIAYAARLGETFGKHLSQCCEEKAK